MAHVPTPSFVLHQVTCQFATDRRFWPAEFIAGTVALRPCRAKWRWQDTPVASAGGPRFSLLRAYRTIGHRWVAQQPTLTAGTTVASLLGYAPVFDALSRLEQGKGWQMTSNC